MAIDPMLYEKLSGRKGDPYSRMGQALAGADEAKSKNRESKEMSYTEARMRGQFKMRIYAAVAIGVVAVLIVIGRAIFG